MRRTCLRCTQDVLFTFLSTVATPKPSYLARGRWLQIRRGLTNDVRMIEADSHATQSFINHGANAADTSFLPRRRPVDINAWREQRAAVFGGSQDAEQTIGQPEEGTSRPADGADATLQPSLLTGGRKKDRWRNRPGFVPGTRPTDDGKKLKIAVQDTPLKHSSTTRPTRNDRSRNQASTGEFVGRRSTADTAVKGRNTPSDERLRSRRSGLEQANSTKIPKLLRTYAKQTAQDEGEHSAKSPEAWQVQKKALKKKFNGAAWSPMKKLSPDAIQGVRQLHTEDPQLWSTPNLAQHFEISPDAIRRILKSKWTPNDAERKKQEDRWVKRGEAIWDRYVELGKKAPRKWRGLEPRPMPREAIGSEKVDIKAEEWSQDRPVVPEEGESRSDLGLAHRIT